MRKTIVTLFILLPTLASARTYDTSNLPYLDIPDDRREAIAISVLTDEGVVEGNPDGTFLPENQLNRAEFIKIVIGLLPDSESIVYDEWCFSDVAPGIWYEAPVCRAKKLGIVRGNEQEGVPPEEWLFAPERPVQYEEAVKVLVEFYELSTEAREDEIWYEQYLRTAESSDLELFELIPGRNITRGQMARLVTGFLAFDEGELEVLREAEALKPEEEPESDSPFDFMGDAEVTPIPPFSSSESAISSASSSAASSVSFELTFAGGYDFDTDLSTRQRFLMLGDTTSVLGFGEFFSDLEPIDISSITITLVDATSSVDAFYVYDPESKLLGKAYQDPSVGSKEYTLSLRNAELVMGKREELSFYVRALMRPYKAGGDSGDSVQISKFTIEGDGVWSNGSFSQSTSETYSIFETARSVITSIENADDAENLLIPGYGMELGSFRLTGETGDNSADLEVTDLEFQIGQAGGITVSNVELSADGTNQRMSCSIASSTVTCSSIPIMYGSLEDRPRTITLYGDISIPSGASNASLIVSINDPGSATSPGSISWTDGTSNFTWVPFDSPIVRWTFYRQ